MNRRYAVSIVIALLWTLVPARAQNPPPQQPKAQSPQTGVKNSVQETNDSIVLKIMKQIAGHEQEPAERVFKNVQIMKTAPAARFLNIMNLGYSRALGVTCTHCHEEQDFSSDAKRPKRAAREMAIMHRGINEQLAKMENLEPNPQGHFINCSTCHRGAVDPLQSEH